MVANASVNVYQNSTEGVASFNITAFDLAGNSLTVNQTQLDSLQTCTDPNAVMLNSKTSA